MKRLIVILFISLNIITAQKALMGNHWTQHSGVEINDIFEETNEQPPESDPAILDNFPPQHLNTMTNQREYWFNLSTLKQNWSGSQWMNDYRVTNTYDDSNNQIGSLYQDWDDTLWVNDSQYILTYDDSNNQIGSLYQDWEGNQWVNVRLYTYTYDANNNPTLYLRQHWDGTQWVNYIQYAHTYDVNNNETSYLYQIWYDSQWMNGWQYTYTYDVSNNRIGVLNQTWDDTLWVNVAQDTYTYDANNNMIGALYHSWDDTLWVNSRLYTNTYDANNNQILMLRQHWEGTQWVNFRQYTRTYDANNNQTSYLYQTWDGTQWVNYYQDTYTYDANNNKTWHLRQTWDGTQLVNDYQHTYTWSSSNPIIDTIPDQEMDEDQSLILTLSAQSPVSDVLYVFSAYSDTSAVILDVNSDTLHIVPAANWVGTALITVIVDPDNDASSDTTGFTLTVTPVNDSPEPFSVIYPSVSDTFSTHTDNDTLIQFRWGKSNDVDSDVTYKLTIELEFFGNTYTDVHENISDTTISISSNSLDPLLDVTSQDDAVFTYFVHAFDEEYTVSSDTGQFVLSRSSLSTINNDVVPQVFALHQNYPNPFNPVTTLRYDLPEDALVNITIYDMMGRKVSTLVSSQKTAGYKSVQWNATNNEGQPVSAGLYLYMIEAGQFRQTKKMVLLK